jgi:pSer/pThr/pTyr-binding forkhead associated (FHA) protein
VPEQLLGLLKLCLLGLLYLFFLRVLWAVWSEVRGPRPAKVPAANDQTRAIATAASKADRKADRKKGTVTKLVATKPDPMKGREFELGIELTVGRAAGCKIALPDDTFVSQLHARVFRNDEGAFVEDLGSTNGTFLNGRKLGAATKLKAGDHLQIGSTVLEVRP